MKGKIALEVIYDDKQENILSYVKINTDTLTKKYDKISKRFIYIQFDNNASLRRILYNTQILTNF